MTGKDGIDHINCYSKGATILGRWLSNFTKCYFVIDDIGFNSMEAAWYWFGLPDSEERDDLRRLSGWAAKQAGRELRKRYEVTSTADEHQAFMKRCAAAKLASDFSMRQSFNRNTLPLKHYYDYGGKIVNSSSSDWLWSYYETLKGLSSNELTRIANG